MNNGFSGNFAAARYETGNSNNSDNSNDNDN